VDQWIPGGDTRQDSVYFGLQALNPCELVLIHDGARPLVRPELIERGIEAAIARGAAVAAVPVTDTIKVVDGTARITATPDRSLLRAAQTPQVFAWQVIQDAYARIGAARSDCTDDASVLELAGFPVYTFLGDRTNIKVSTPADVAVVRALWDAMEGEQT
jgi:2-C-methyl-D-erythritol 4-phosphate cytidylyltransferase